MANVYYGRDFDGFDEKTGKPTKGIERCKARFERKLVPGPDGKQKEKIVCRITIAGDKDNQPVLSVTDDLKRRFPEEWVAFQEGREATVRGTPLERLALNERIILDLKVGGVMCVEDLANLTDGACQGFRTGTSLRRKAREYMDGVTATPAQEVTALKGELADLKGQMAQLIAALNTKQSGPAEPLEAKRKPGPKPKCETDAAA